MNSKNSSTPKKEDALEKSKIPNGISLHEPNKKSNQNPVIIMIKKFYLDYVSESKEF